MKSKVASLDQHPGYAEAKAKLDRLTEARAGHAETVRRLEIQMTRHSEEVRRYATSGISPIAPKSSVDLDVEAPHIIAAGDVPAALLQRVRRPAPDAFLEQSEEEEFLNALSGERSALLLLDRAILIQRREFKSQKRTASRMVLESIAKDRSRIARSVAAALIGLASALTEEMDLATELRAQDPTLPEMLRPPSPPAELFFDRPVVAWMATALEIPLPGDGASPVEWMAGPGRAALGKVR